MYGTQLTLFSYIRYILHHMEGEGDEECPEALERGGVYFECPICFDKKRNQEGCSMICCRQRICNDCGGSHEDTCRRRSLELTCPYCRAVILDEKGNKRLLMKQGEYRIVYMTDI